MATDTAISCAVCGKEAPYRWQHCLEGVDVNGQLTPTNYCGRDCQAVHWKDHKSACRAFNDRKVLYRAGTLIQRAFDIPPQVL